MFEQHLQHIVFKTIAKLSALRDEKVFVVGGYVRDLILNNPGNDIDIVTEKDGISLANAVAAELHPIPKVSVFKTYGTAHFHYQGIDWEFVGARRESYKENSRNPNVYPGSIEDDQKRRDFTINAMAISLGKDFGMLSDPFNGRDDLVKGIIRTPVDPETTYSDDPLRMLRAIRFSARFGFSIEDKSFEAIKNLRQRISIVAPERIAEELNKMLMADKPSEAIILLEKTKLLHHILIEVDQLKGVEYKEGKGHKDNFFHSLEVLDKVAHKSNNLWLRWAALLHDIGKPKTKRFELGSGWTFHAHDAIGGRMVEKIFERLKLPQNEKMHYTRKIVELHLRPIALVEDTVSDSAIRRLLFDAGDAIDDLMCLCEADVTSKNQAKVQRYLKNFTYVRQRLIEIEEKDRLRNWQPPIDGETIMKTFGLKPCRDVGLIKNAIREAILDGKIDNNYDDAYSFMIEEGLRMGLKVS